MSTTVTFDPDVEEQLRRRMRKKGDLSRIVNDALRAYFEENEEEKET